VGQADRHGIVLEVVAIIAAIVMIAA